MPTMTVIRVRRKKLKNLNQNQSYRSISKPKFGYVYIRHLDLCIMHVFYECKDAAIALKYHNFLIISCKE